jgi:hypothetical protein
VGGGGWTGEVCGSAFSCVEEAREEITARAALGVGARFHESPRRSS